jgi:hypothetical protein
MYRDVAFRLDDSMESPTVEEFLKQNGINLDDFDEEGQGLGKGDKKMGHRVYFSRKRIIPTGKHSLHHIDVSDIEDSTCESSVGFDDDVRQYPIQLNYIVVTITLLLLFMLVPLFISGPYGDFKSGENVEIE